MYTLPVDPDLPQGFYDTSIEDRNPEEITVWWDTPYAISRQDGKYDVRCLDGGTWDRPTFYGIADTLEEASALAEQKLKAWQATRARPTLSIEEDGGVSVVRMPQSPLEDQTVLGSFDSMEKAKKYLDSLDQAK